MTSRSVTSGGNEPVLAILTHNAERTKIASNCVLKKFAQASKITCLIIGT